MFFNSIAFVVFFAGILLLHSLPLKWTVKKVNLLLASYLFYSAWNPPFVVLLWLSTVVDWWAAQRIARSDVTRHRRGWMLLSIIANIGLLAYFKYGEFLLENVAPLIEALGLHASASAHDIVLPVGISFYTFATMSYTLDVYLGRAKPSSSFLDFALFVTFFPHLVAGPIMRPTELVPQFEKPRRASVDQFHFGLLLITLGLFQKVVLADGFLAQPTQLVFDAKELPGALDAWFSTFAFSAQIFCDFAGYSTAAIGIAMCLGFGFPQNFRSPYGAVGFSDFWRRWHITLSTYLRDYLYIPLGGNRHGALRTHASLMTTMLIGGLWHGASWTFVAWGGLHGLFLSAERLLRARFAHWRPGPASIALLGLLTWMLINLTWVFFRAKTFGRAQAVFAGMLGQHPGAAPILAGVQLIATGVIVSLLVAAHWFLRNQTLESIMARVPATALSLMWALMAFAIVIEQETGNAFIYFQF